MESGTVWSEMTGTVWSEMGGTVWSVIANRRKVFGIHSQSVSRREVLRVCYRSGLKNGFYVKKYHPYNLH